VDPYEANQSYDHWFRGTGNGIATLDHATPEPNDCSVCRPLYARATTAAKLKSATVAIEMSQSEGGSQ
jgi:hypothetical protein